jgi:dTDP-4-dehydrorhamnose 3,5-epimerase
VSLSPKASSLYKLQSYAGRPAIAGVVWHALRRFHDDGGALTELVRLTAEGAAGIDGFRPVQVNYSCLQPGAIKGLHVHLRQTDVWFVPPEDRVLAVLVDVRAGSASEGQRMRAVLGDGESALLRIPPGVAHGLRNLGVQPARILYFTDRFFSAEPDECDEGRLPWDLVGREVWDVAIE